MDDDKIYLFRLAATGQDVIAEQIGYDNQVHAYRLQNPIVLIPARDGIAMMDMLMLAEGDAVNIAREHVLFRVKPVQELANAYKQKNGGVITPDKSLILPNQ